MDCCVSLDSMALHCQKWCLEEWPAGQRVISRTLEMWQCLKQLNCSFNLNYLKFKFKSRYLIQLLRKFLMCLEELGYVDLLF